MRTGGPKPGSTLCAMPWAGERVPRPRRGGARPPLSVVVAFIDANKDDLVDGRRLEGELICRLLQAAPSSYYAAKTHTPSTRARWDEELIPQLVGL